MTSQSGVILQSSIKDLHWDPRMCRPLYAADLHTIGDLVDCTRADLLSLPGFGEYALRRVEKWLGERGLYLSGTRYGPHTAVSLTTLTPSVQTALREAGLCTLGDLQQRHHRDLLTLPGIGPWAVSCIERVLRQMAIHEQQVQPAEPGQEVASEK